MQRDEKERLKVEGLEAGDKVYYKNLGTIYVYTVTLKKICRTFAYVKKKL